MVDPAWSYLLAELVGLACVLVSTEVAGALVLVEEEGRHAIVG